MQEVTAQGINIATEMVRSHGGYTIIYLLSNTTYHRHIVDAFYKNMYVVIIIIYISLDLI